MEQNICPNCNAVLENNSAFCSNCGSPVSAKEEQLVYQQPTYQQPVYQQPAYQQPVYQQPTFRSRSNACGIVGMVFGILAISLLVIAVMAIFAEYLDYKNSWFGDYITFWDVAEDMLEDSAGLDAMVIFSAFFALGSLPLSIVGLCLRNRSKGTAVAGLVLSVICLLVTLSFMSL